VNPITLVCLFFGYMLVYASTAAHGRFATNPWGGVLHDAYKGDDKGPAGAQGPVGTSAAVSAPEAGDIV